MAWAMNNSVNAVTVVQKNASPVPSITGMIALSSPVEAIVPIPVTKNRISKMAATTSTIIAMIS